MWTVICGLLAFFILLATGAHYAWFVGLVAWAWWVLTRNR